MPNMQTLNTLWRLLCEVDAYCPHFIKKKTDILGDYRILIPLALSRPGKIVMTIYHLGLTDSFYVFKSFYK